ncbi:MAG: nucleotidyltransferase domain-containing protein [Myxococcota bacterium]
MDPELRHQLTTFFAARPWVRLALVFGSQARGTARGDSDVDVAVRGRDLDTVALALELGALLGRQADVVDLDQAGYPLLKAITREGVLVYQSRPGEEARWRSQAWTTLETERPWFERMRDAYLSRLAESGRSRG